MLPCCCSPLAWQASISIICRNGSHSTASRHRLTDLATCLHCCCALLCHVPQNLMREYMHNNDRALSNIEALPGGFNALRQLYENVQVCGVAQQAQLSTC
eukprot:GHRQ01040114.1.p2 GENE.GHRQ01040114.1~~GHRQ01040114.1.p2  ORF type:complete len:100 (-),score=29.86 GHRQ01040114.1:39-338(-)